MYSSMASGNHGKGHGKKGPLTSSLSIATFRSRWLNDRKIRDRMRSLSKVREASRKITAHPPQHRL